MTADLILLLTLCIVGMIDIWRERIDDRATAMAKFNMLQGGEKRASLTVDQHSRISGISAMEPKIIRLRRSFWAACPCATTSRRRRCKGLS